MSPSPLRAVRALLLTGALLAAPVAFADAPAWSVDHDASRLGFAGQQNGSGFDGAFERWQADIRFDPEALDDSQVVVTIETGSAVTGLADRDSMMRGAAWFATERYPEAVFESTGFRHLGGDAYEADAVLTIRDLSREMVLPFTLEIDDRTARMVGEATVIRTDFDVGTGDFAGPSPVALEVLVAIDLTAHRAD